MLETHVRPALQPLFNVIGRVLIALKVTPNVATVCALVTGGACGFYVSMNEMPVALALLWVSGFFDVIDGTIARITNKTRKIGAYMDLVSDRLVECSVMIGFALLYPQHAVAYVAFLAAELLHFSTSLAAASIFRNKGVKSSHYDRSIIERGETFIVFSAMMLFPEYLFEILMALTSLSVLSTLARFMRVTYAARLASKIK